MKWIFETRKSTLIGLLGGLSILAVMIVISHRQIGDLFNLPGLLMVFGGTLAATLVSRPVQDVVRSLKTVRSLLGDERVEIDAEVTHLLNTAQWYRTGNIREAEAIVNQIENALLRSGLQMILDREPLEDVVKTLKWRIAGLRSRELGDAQILRTMAMFAPAFGMLGTLFGLIQMLGSLGNAALTEIGAMMSFALITTLYGLLLANMVLKPLAMKMERRTEHRTLIMNLIVEGIVLLAERRHPMAIKDALTTFMLQHQATQPSSGGLAKAA